MYVDAHTTERAAINGSPGQDEAVSGKSSLQSLLLGTLAGASYQSFCFDQTAETHRSLLGRLPP